jgi:hypothetical protein
MRRFRLVVLVVSLQKLLERAHVERAIHSQRPAEGLAFEGVFDALGCGMHPGASAGKGRGAIHDGLAADLDHPREEGTVGALAAAKASSCRIHLIPFSNHMPESDIPGPGFPRPGHPVPGEDGHPGPACRPGTAISARKRVRSADACRISPGRGSNRAGCRCGRP